MSNNSNHRKLSSVYVSCPMSVEASKLNKVIETTKSLGVSTSYWQRGTTYNELGYADIIKKSDAFILIMPDNRWNMTIEKLSAGSQKELRLALRAGKPVFIVYQASSGFNIYNAVINDHNDFISGISGTSHNFAWASKGEIDWNHPTGIEPKSWLDKQMEDMGRQYHEQMEQYVDRSIRGIGVIPIIDHTANFTRRSALMPPFLIQTDKRILLSKRS